MREWIIDRTPLAFFYVSIEKQANAQQSSQIFSLDTVSQSATNHKFLKDYTLYVVSVFPIVKRK